MEFILGCNYWASNAGTEMWRNWDEEAIESDMKILNSHSVKYLRVFPNWRDFQPITPVMGKEGIIKEYCLENDVMPSNPYFLDEKMMDRFSKFCDICKKYDMKLIVGLLTGWMSGRLFIPSALFGKNLFTDPTALLFQQRFIKGFIERFKDREEIYAWDLGNECNCMCTAQDRFAATNWTGVISNAIRANDPKRPIVSGMHGISADDAGPAWSISGQAEFTDILTTHPYPYWVTYAGKDEIGSFRTVMHATSENKLYHGVGGKECLVEEIGTMGPMLCSDERAADFLRCNLFSNFANGALGVMWWCANEQTNLKTIPYTRNMCEVELGMIYADRKPKPVLTEMKKFSEFINKLDFELPKAREDAVCILTQSQQQWGVAYMTYCLAKQADINLRFTYCNRKLPNSDVYMMPSISRSNIMPAENYNLLKQKVYEGATLYISNDNGILSDFNSFAGVKILDSSLQNQNGSIELDNETIEFSRERKYRMIADGAKVIAFDDEKNPAIIKHIYGKGVVYYVNFPLESMLLDESNAFDTNRYLIYKKIFSDLRSKMKVTSDNKYISVTEHSKDGKTYCIAINYSQNEQNTMFSLKDCKIGKVFYGNTDVLPPFDAVVFEIEY